MQSYTLVTLFVCLGFGWGAHAQSTPETTTELVRDLVEQVKEMRRELAAARAESVALRQEIHAIRQQLTPATPQDSTGDSSVGQLREEQELLASKVDDQYQTKVESSSKYRVKFTGMALFTGGSVRGAVDSIDLPAMAVARNPGESKGSVGGSIRQSILGFDVIGPKLAGAATRGELRLDFYGGLPGVADGSTLGLARIRTATFTMDWERHKLEVGQEAPFISPLSPTSLLSTAYPAFASSGNLWIWTPQVHITHRLRPSAGSEVTIQYGVLDPLTGEPPAEEYNRTPSAGERSSRPAYAVRLGASGGGESRRVAVGASGYYSRQNWGFSRRVDSWATTADWEVKLARWLALSGELYRGRAIGGLGGGAGDTVLKNGSLALFSSTVRPVDSAGGWAQLKYKPVARWEFNMAFGGDLPYSPHGPGVALFLSDQALAPKRNKSAFWNVIYQPRNNLLFSVEYRKLWTAPFQETLRRASYAGVGAGVLF